MFPIRSPYHQEQRRIDVRSEVEVRHARLCRADAARPRRRGDRIIWPKFPVQLTSSYVLTGVASTSTISAAETGRRY